MVRYTGMIFDGTEPMIKTAPLHSRHRCHDCRARRYIGSTLGPRPFFLVDRLEEGVLKSKLAACTGPFMKSDWSIGHRGAPLQFPEHTVESYTAAARMGAGILECDVTFTKDKELVCRHAQNDLHTTTNILATGLAGKCTAGFKPAQGGEPASAECRASDITLAEFRTLNGKMDAANKQAKSVEEYLDGTASWRTDLYATRGTLMTHAESIELFKSLGAKFTPELKAPSVEMPYDGFTQEMYAQKLIDEYKAAGIPASDVFAQSFNLEDVLYWIENEPEFGKQAVYLDGRYSKPTGGRRRKSRPGNPPWQELKEMGVNFHRAADVGSGEELKTARWCRRSMPGRRKRPGSISSHGRWNAPARSPPAGAGTTRPSAI